MRNLLSSFDEFKGRERIAPRDYQDYTGRYNDLRDEWKQHREHHEKEDIDDDIVFEIELVKQIEINIDYILMLVRKYHDSNCQDKDILVSIRKAVSASPKLRSKKELIENFIAQVDGMDDVEEGWSTYVKEERDKDLQALITQERLKPKETRKFMEDSFRDGEIKTTGTDIDQLMPPMSRFGGSGREKKKQTLIEKFEIFFEKYFGVSGQESF